MGDQSVGNDAENLQPGALLGLGSAIVGIVIGSLLETAWGGYFGHIGSGRGDLLAFIAISYILHGRCVDGRADRLDSSRPIGIHIRIVHFLDVPIGEVRRLRPSERAA